jgi:hypothetical protein
VIALFSVIQVLKNLESNDGLALFHPKNINRSGHDFLFEHKGIGHLYKLLVFCAAMK